MKVSLEFVDKNGNRDLTFISATYGFCFMVILLRKHLEESNDSSTTSRDNLSLDNTNITYQSPNNNEGDDQNLLAASDTGRRNIPLVTLARDQPKQHEISMPSLKGSRENVIGSQRDLRQKSSDINEQNWENIPPKLYNDTSTEDGEEENVPSISNFEVKEDEGSIITRPQRNSCFAEEPSANDNIVGKMEEREVTGQGTRNEEQDMRSTASSSHSHRKIVGSTAGETQIMNHQMEGNKDQSQESDSQDYEIDNNNPLLPKSGLDKDDDDDDDDDDSHHESSDGEESDGNDFQFILKCLDKVLG